MSYAFQGISTLSSALEAFQTQLDVTGQNISNVNTPGYSDEQVNLSESPTGSQTYGSTFQLGSGVNIASVTRVRDMYLQGSSLASNASLGAANSQTSATSSANEIVADPNNTGLASAIDGFYNAWQSLAATPGTANQQAVLQAGQTVASDITSTYSSIQGLQSSTSGQISSTIQQIQSYSNQIASLNQEILSAQGGGSTPNSLMDQRDQVVQQLSSLANVNVQQYGNGSYEVSMGNLQLVNQSGAQTVPTQFNTSTMSLTDGANSYPVQSGQLSGLMTAVNQLNGYESNLNTLAGTISSTVNAVYATGVNSSGTTGANFFDGSDASDLAVDPAIVNNPSTIATGASGEAADVGVAQQLGDLGTQSQANLGGLSPTQYYGQLVSQIGSDGQNALNSQSTQTALNQQIQNQISSTSGVNLDQEMNNLLQFQRSYQAAAQAVSSMDQVVQSLLQSVSA
jgi:flagellar hook-associated protein 1 FlgK